MDTIGWIHYKMGDFNLAYDFIEAALNKSPEDPVHNYHMGAVLFSSGKLNEAWEKLKNALSANESFSGREDAEKMLGQIS